MKEVLKYVCDHCGREYRRKSNAEHHEAICWKNPELKACPTCIHFKGFDYESDGSEFGRTRYIVCVVNSACNGDIPETNCECWVHDLRIKKQKDQERLNELIRGLGETGLTI